MILNVRTRDGYSETASEPSSSRSTSSIQFIEPLLDFLKTQGQEIKSLKIRKYIGLLFRMLRNNVIKFLESLYFVTFQNRLIFSRQERKLVLEKCFEPLFD